MGIVGGPFPASDLRILAAHAAIMRHFADRFLHPESAACDRVGSLAEPSLALTVLTDDTTGGLSPDWSPDGTEIAIFGDGDVYVMGADGAEIRRLTNDSGADFEPDW
jgi:hypothetical protein